MSKSSEKDGKGKERKQIPAPQQNASCFLYVFTACMNYYSLQRKKIRLNLLIKYSNPANIISAFY